MAYDEHRQNVVLFGGFGSGGELNDTWTWDGSTWTQLQPRVVPPGRNAASLAYDARDHQTVLFGGCCQNSPYQAFNDTWTWDGRSWTEQVPDVSPSGRVGAALSYDDALHEIVLFGGANASPFNDTWLWDGHRWNEARSRTSPGIRSAASLAYDPSLKSTVLFGGDTNGIDNADTWIGR